MVAPVPGVGHTHGPIGLDGHDLDGSEVHHPLLAEHLHEFLDVSESRDLTGDPNCRRDRREVAFGFHSPKCAARVCHIISWRRQTPVDHRYARKSPTTLAVRWGVTRSRAGRAVIRTC